MSSRDEIKTTASMKINSSLKMELELLFCISNKPHMLNNVKQTFPVL
jgi:hypothetical protein